MNGIQQTQNLRLEKKKLNLEIKKVLLEIIQAANIENVMKCFTTFEALANKSGFIPIKNNSIIKDLGVDNKAWEEIDTNGDNLIEMNEWIQFWYQLEKQTNYCQFCKEPKFETCFICMRGFCAEHYQFEKTSEKRLCSDCIKKHHNDPKRLEAAVITKLKEIKEYEIEKIMVRKKTHQWWHWKPGLPQRKCGYIDCENIGALKCNSCGVLCCSMCISKRIISSKYACINCHTKEKRKVCYTRNCKELSWFTCNNINCRNVTCINHVTAMVYEVKIEEVKVLVPVTVCYPCAAVSETITVGRLPLQCFAQKFLDCNGNLCHCCCTAIVGQTVWICLSCPVDTIICETCDSLEIDFDEHNHKNHEMILYDSANKKHLGTKNGSKKQEVKTTKTETSKVATSQAKTATTKTSKVSECEPKLTNEVICKTTKCSKCSKCSQSLIEITKTYKCKVCDYKMCADCFNSASFPASSGHSVSHDVGLHFAGNELLVISGSHTSKATKSEAETSKVADQTSTTRNLPASTSNTTQCAYMSGFNTGGTQAPYMSNLGGTAAGVVSTATKKPSYLSNLGNKQPSGSPTPKQLPYSPTPTTVKTPIYTSGTETQSPYMTGLGGGNPSGTQPAYTSGGVPTATKQPSYMSNLGNKQPSGSPTPKPAYMGNW